MPGSEKMESVQILRSKAYLTTDDGKEYILQGVREIFEVKEVEGSDVEVEAKLVLIGRGLTPVIRDKIEQYLREE